MRENLDRASGHTSLPRLNTGTFPWSYDFRKPHPFSIDGIHSSVPTIEANMLGRRISLPPFLSTTDKIDITCVPYPAPPIHYPVGPHRRGLVSVRTRRVPGTKDIWTSRYRYALINIHPGAGILICLVIGDNHLGKASGYTHEIPRIGVEASPVGFMINSFQ